jgi:hypothetical protein
VVEADLALGGPKHASILGLDPRSGARAGDAHTSAASVVGVEILESTRYGAPTSMRGARQ